VLEAGALFSSSPCPPLGVGSVAVSVVKKLRQKVSENNLEKTQQAAVKTIKSLQGEPEKPGSLQAGEEGLGKGGGWGFSK